MKVLQGIADFLGLQHSEDELRQASAQVRTSSIGKGQKACVEENTDLLGIMQPLLERHKYL